MKKILSVLVLLSSALLAEHKMEYTLSYVGMNMDYKEYDRAGILLDSEYSDYSDITGFEFGYSYFLDTQSQIDFRYMQLSGDTQYVGSYLGSTQGYGSVVSVTTNDIRDIYLGMSGKNPLSNGFSLLGNLGIGYRYWQRTLSSVQVEDYEWYSLRLGIGVEYRYSALSIGIHGEYQYGINPIMKATGISEDFQLESADIMQLSIPVRYDINNIVALECSYVFTRQEIQESNIVFDMAGYGYVEPDSTAYNQYLKIGIIFKY